jgi:hypothetical protein
LRNHRSQEESENDISEDKMSGYYDRGAVKNSVTIRVTVDDDEDDVSHACGVIDDSGVVVKIVKLNTSSL